MGTGFSLDTNEHRAAAGVVEGYGEMQAEHGTTLASATSTPLSSSGVGIAGAISQIAQGTVQKIVTDVTSTTKGFADDTAKGLRTQADSMDQLETDLAGHARSILNGAPSSLPGGGYSGMATMASSPSYGNGGMPTTMSSPLTTDDPLGESPLGEAAAGESGLAESGVIGAGSVGQESSMMPSGRMRGGAGADTSEERGKRPNYLKSKELTDDDRAKAAIDKHLKECGAAPIPLSPSRLVCAKCGSILKVDDAQSSSLAE